MRMMSNSKCGNQCYIDLEHEISVDQSDSCSGSYYGDETDSEECDDSDIDSENSSSYSLESNSEPEVDRILEVGPGYNESSTSMNQFNIL